MNSDSRIELTFKDATDSESEPVRLVTPELIPEASEHTPEELSPKYVSPMEELKAKVESEQAATAQEFSAAQVASAAQAVSAAQVDSASLSACGNSEPPSPAYNFAGSYAFEPSRSSLFPDFKQVFNCAYFTAAALASADLVTTLDNDLLLVFPVLFSIFAVGAFVYSINQRVHISDFSVTLSTRTRFLIRSIALLIPIPIIAGAVCVRLSDLELDLANTAYDAAQYGKATDHLNQAINLNPFNEGAYDAFSRVYFMQSAWGLANEFAQKAIALDPNDSYAWSDKARPLHMMQKNSEAITAAEKAVQLDPTNGQAFSTLAESNLELGKYEAALDAAQKHTKIHSDEPYAFELTANILRKMGRDAEAAAAETAFTASSASPK